ncbi:MAG: radical SAM protein [Clostridia bacterium]|nr:radical SAM protein [Clostridia bacterium]
MEKCYLCPRNCGVDRSKQKGVYGAGDKLIISYSMLHHFEEPIISGEPCDTRGSGAIFFGGCNMKCVYCQNYDLSHHAKGEEVSVLRLAYLMEFLEKQGAYNINLVTPTHFSDKIVEALKIYKPNIPVVWNTSGYEKPEVIEKLKGYVDIFLTDLKYYDSKLSLKLSKSSDYFEYATKSILKMREIVGEDVIENGMMKKGLIVRHLVLPNYSADSIKILEWLKENLGKNTIVSIMNQYVAFFKAKEMPEMNRRVTAIEYKRVVQKALSLGLNNAYIQESSSADEVYVPPFNNVDKNLLKKVKDVN